MDIILLFILLILFIVIGVPIAFSVGISSLVILFIKGIPISQLITKMFGGLDSFTILAIPFFILVGIIMNKSKLTTDLVELSSSLVGHVKGGLAHVNVLSSMFFAGISGSSTADSAAIGSIMIPAMVKEGYDKPFSAAITASSSSIGPIIPPSIMMIIYSSLTGASVAGLFLGGIFPGVMIGIGLMILSYILTDKHFKPNKYFVSSEKHFKIRKVFSALKKSLWVLPLPVIILGGITCGIFTATEAGAIAFFYSLFISFFIYRSMDLKSLKGAIFEAAKTVGIVLLLLATASIFGNVLTLLDFPSMAISFLTSITDIPMVMLLIIIVFLFVLGFFIDGIAIMIMFVPTLHRVASQLGFDPIFFGVLVVVSVLIGGITPPVGVLLFINSKIANISFEELVSAIWPHVLVMLIVVFIMALFPETVTFIPSLLLK